MEMSNGKVEVIEAIEARELQMRKEGDQEPIAGNVSGDLIEEG